MFKLLMTDRSKSAAWSWHYLPMCLTHVRSSNPSLGVSSCCHSFFSQHTFGSLLLCCLLSCRLTPNGSISRLTSRRLHFQDKLFDEWGEFVSPCCRVSGDWNTPSACLTDRLRLSPPRVCVSEWVSVWGKPVAGSHADTQTLPPITYSVTAPRSTHSTPAEVRGGDEKKEKTPKPNSENGGFRIDVYGLY